MPGRNPSALLDFVEEPLNKVARPIEVRAETDGVPTIALGRDVGPLMITEFKAHNTRLPFGNLNHVRAHAFNGNPRCPQWPNDRTNGRSYQIDAIGLQCQFGCGNFVCQWRRQNVQCSGVIVYQSG